MARRSRFFLLSSFVLAASIGTFACAPEQPGGEGGARMTMAALHAASCSSGAECASGHCVDGVCCDSACSGLCEACSVAVKGAGIDGLCEAIGNETDPENECIMGCNGDGACIETGFLIASGNACSVNSDCQSGFCVDGVCCDNACTDACKACNVAGQEGICSENFPGACAAQCNGEIGLPDPPNVNGWGPMVAGDLNGDGMDDLVASGTQIFLARGHGFFNLGDSIPSLPYGTKELADLDNDGDLDLIVVSGTFTYVMKNMGNGSFDNLVSLPLGTAAKDVTTGDFNGDGFVDIAAAHGNVSVFLNVGNGTFGAPVVYAGFTTKRLSAADMDGDGDRDLVLMDFNKFRILMNPGNGSFTVGTTTTTDMYGVYFDLATADADSDGDIDLLITDYEYCNVRVKLNPGNGAFPPITYDWRACTSFKYNHDLFVGDFDGDNKPDYLSPLGNQFSVHLLRSSGSGPPTYFTGSIPETLAGGDFDGDGDLDAAVSASLGFKILINTGNGTFTSPIPPKISIGVRTTIASADVNSDGIMDLLNTNSSGISVRVGLGNATFNPPVNYPTGTGAGKIVAGDLNGDAKPDLAVANGGSSTVSVLLNQGNGTYAPKVDYTLGANPTGLALEDVNGDNRSDLIVGTANQVSVLLNQGFGAFGNATHHPIGAKSQVAVFDFTGDGMKDIIVAPAANNANALGTLINQGNGTFTAGATISTPGMPNELATGHLDGNGRVDLAVGYLYSSYNGVFLNSGNGSLTPQPLTGVWFTGSSVIADVNGDAINDIASFSVLTGGPAAPNPGLFVLANTGNGTSYTTENRIPNLTCCGNPGNIIAADFNGDGHQDLAYSLETEIYFQLSDCLQ